MNMSTRNIYLLDTCVCIALLKKSPSVIQRLREVGTSKSTIFVSQKGYHTAMLRHVLGETLGLSAYEPSYVSAS